MIYVDHANLQAKMLDFGGFKLDNSSRVDDPKKRGDGFMDLNMPQIAAVLAKNDPTVSAELLTSLRKEMGLNRADFARMVGLSERSVATWEAGADLKESSLRSIVEIGRLYAKLRQSFASPEQLATWLKTSNSAFDGSQPLQVIERGEIDRVWRMIYFLESGSSS
jgi:transcriptional regulator with XRE-family HTH domain